MNHVMLKFITQAGFSFMVLVTCIYLVCTDQGKENHKIDTLAWSGLTGTMSAWLPAPQLPGEPQPPRPRTPRRRRDD